MSKLHYICTMALLLSNNKREASEPQNDEWIDLTCVLLSAEATPKCCIV